MSAFAAVFVNYTPAISDTVFKQVDPTHWVLDVSSLVTPAYWELKEVALFLTQPNVLPPDVALSLYVSLGGQDWSFRGCISNSHPSEVVPLSWPEPPGGSPVQAPGFCQLGVSVEPLAEATAKEGAKLGVKEDFCRRVGMDLFQYMQSFGGVGQVGSDKLLVPADVLDKWFNRISTRLRKDPDFLTRNKDVI